MLIFLQVSSPFFSLLYGLLMGQSFYRMDGAKLVAHRKTINILVSLVSLVWLTPIEAQNVQLLSTDADGIMVRVQTPVLPVAYDTTSGGRYHDLSLPSLPRLERLGNAALPFIAEALAVPPGARVRLEVKTGRYTDIPDIDYFDYED